MKPSLPGVLPVSILMLAGVLVVWLGLAGPLDLSKLEKWQPLLGAVITGAGILVASWNVTRQMRLTARSKEIDRLEDDLPGMRDAHYLMSRVVPLEYDYELTAQDILSHFRNVKISGPGTDIIKQVEEALPSTHDAMRREVIRKSFTLHGAATGLIYYERRLAEVQTTLRTSAPGARTAAEKDFERISSELAKYRVAFSGSIDAFSAYRSVIRKNVDTGQARLDKLRKALEKHIDD